MDLNNVHPRPSRTTALSVLWRLARHVAPAAVARSTSDTTVAVDGVLRPTPAGASLRSTILPAPPGVTVEAPLGPAGFGARVGGVDLSLPLPASTVAFLLATFHEHQVRV